MNGKISIIISSTIVGVCIYTYLYFSETGLFPYSFGHSVALSTVLALSAISGYLISKSGPLLSRQISWHDSPGLRFITGFLINNLIVFMLPAVAYFIADFLELTLGRKFLGLLINQDLVIKWMLLNFIALLIFNVTSLTAFSYNHYVNGQIEAVKLSRKQYELQFEALRNQLSPHYLFNSLNTISSLIYIDKTKAEDYIRKLVKTHQYILNTRDQKLVTLKRELDFIRSYQYLLKVRYEDAFKMSVDLPDELMSSPIPPLTLQILVENAIKHNIVSASEPLSVAIHLNEKGLLTVSNNKNIKLVKEKSFHIGIENIKRRYRFFTQQSIQVLNTDQFEVVLPILSKG